MQSSQLSSMSDVCVCVNDYNNFTQNKNFTHTYTGNTDTHKTFEMDFIILQHHCTIHAATPHMQLD